MSTSTETIEQLATRDPKLVVLQYGTNEADDPELVLYPAFADTHHHQLQVRR